MTTAEKQAVTEWLIGHHPDTYESDEEWAVDALTTCVECPEDSEPGDDAAGELIADAWEIAEELRESFNAIKGTPQ